MKKIKQLVSVLLVVLTLFSVSAISPAMAAEANDDIAVYVVVARWNIPAATCKQAYNEMNGSKAWSSKTAQAVANALSPVVGAAYGTGEWLLQLNYDMTKEAFRQGAQNGKGCTMLIYDTALPCVIVNR